MKPYTFHITLYDVAFVATIFIGLTFALLLWFSGKARRLANRFLALALAVAVLWVARVLGTGIGLSAYFPDWGRIPLQFSLALGPLIYYYVLAAARPEYKFRLKDMLHFSPLLLEMGAQLFVPALNSVIPWLAFISVLSYLYLSHKLIERFYRGLKFNELSDRYRYQLRWLHRWLTVFGLFWLLWIPFAVVHYYYQSGMQVYYPLYLLLMLMMIWLAAAAHLRPENEAAKDTAPVSRPLLPAALKQKGIWLKKVVKENRCYLDPGLSLGSLAEKLDVSPHELSRIINTAFKKSFNDFINEYRITEVVQKMQDPAYDHLTLMGIAYDAGFNSPSTFHRAFRGTVGKTPAEYKKELPSYNLTYSSRSAAVISNRETTLKWSREKLNRNVMFRNYLKIAWRNIVRYKAYSAINIAGLTVGITAFLLIFLVVGYEQSFDQFHVNKDQLFRVVRIGRDKVSASYRTGVPFPVTAGLRSNFPQLANAGAIMPDGDVQVIIRDKGNGAEKKFKEDQGIFFAEPQFFDMFSFPLVAGEYRNSLKMPGNVLLTQGWADKYFGRWQTAIGKTFSMDGVPVKVCGILKDMPANTDFPIKAVLSYATLQKFGVNMNNWGNINDDNYCFIQLKKGDSPQQFSRQLDQFTNKYIKPVNPGYFLSIQPLNEMHYDGRYGTFEGRVFSKDLILALSTVGIFLLVIACVNFVNLNTAQAVNRAREVGVRKVLGSNRGQVILQFLGEAAIVSCFALLIALAGTALLIPAVNQLLDIRLAASALYHTNMVLFIAATLVAVILLAGFYPAFLLSGFNAARVLKSALSVGQGGISLRRGLVVFQFATAQVLIIATLVVASQMSYFYTADMGFDKEAIITASFPGDSVGFNRQGVLRNELLKIPGVEKVSFGMGAPIGGGWFTDLRKPDNTSKEPDMVTAIKMDDTSFFSLFQMRFVAGRTLPQIRAANSW